MKRIVEKSILGKSWVTHVLKDDEFIDLDTLIINIIKARGIETIDVEKFLNPTVKEYMPDPYLMQDMERAVKIISKYIYSGQKIAVYGDYDVDGITSTAIFIKYLKELGADTVWHLPTRDGEGYGLNNDAIDSLADQDVKLIITVDCGIGGVDEVKYAKEKGIAVVVTDHHSPDIVLPNADAVVNPKRADDTSGLSYLAGVGVAFLTIVALNRYLKENDENSSLKENANNINLLQYLDLVALGTICDAMNLVELNRAFVYTGLKIMGLRQNLGLANLMDVAGVKKPSVYSVGFALGPRLNASGRIDSANPSLELLLTDNPLIASELAEKLHKMNQERIDIQNAIMLAADRRAEQIAKENKFSIFISGDNWHGGIMGIIAGRLKEKYNMPICVASRVHGKINGSGRSIDDVDLGKIIHEASARGILTEGGGHAAAAGFSLMADKENEFIEFLENSVKEQLGGEKKPVEICVDVEMDAGGANMNFIKKLSQLEPFGQGNPEPVLVLNGGTLSWVGTMGTGNHLRGVVNTNTGQLNFVGFNMVGTKIGDFLLDDANINTKIKLLGKLKENEFKGRISAQFILDDLAI